MGCCQEDRRNQNKTTESLHKEQTESRKEVGKRSGFEGNPEEHQTDTDISATKTEDSDYRRSEDNRNAHGYCDGNQLMVQLRQQQQQQQQHQQQLLVLKVVLKSVNCLYTNFITGRCMST